MNRNKSNEIEINRMKSNESNEYSAQREATMAISTHNAIDNNGRNHRLHTLTTLLQRLSPHSAYTSLHSRTFHSNLVL